MYVKTVEKQKETKYNGLGSSDKYTLEKHPEPKLLEKIDYNNKKEVMECLKRYENIIRSDNIENAIVITKDGEVYQCYGNSKNVWPDYDLKEKLADAYMTHNHPERETEYSFSELDIGLFNDYNLKVLRGTDYKYTYELNRNAKDVDELNIFEITDDDEMHGTNINRAIRRGFGYRRWKNE